MGRRGDRAADRQPCSSHGQRRRSACFNRHPNGGQRSLSIKCVSAIFGRTLHRNFEVIIVPSYSNAQPELIAYLRTLSADPKIRVVDYKGPYNFSRKCNLGAAAANGEVVIFYNDDVFVITQVDSGDP